MIKSLCVVGKSSSILCRTALADMIDNHDIVIRVNHIPDNSNFKKIGIKTDIFSSRSLTKTLNYIDKIKKEKIWICSDNITYYKYVREKYIKNPNIVFFKKKFDELNFINREEMNHLKDVYKNKFKDQCFNYHDERVGYCIPDTGMTTISLAILRFPDYKINICGFDLYSDGNENIFESNKNHTIFETPVLQELLVLKKLIKSSKISIL
jgi:hypothetical protein